MCWKTLGKKKKATVVWSCFSGKFWHIGDPWNGGFLLYMLILFGTQFLEV